MNPILTRPVLVDSQMRGARKSLLTRGHLLIEGIAVAVCAALSLAQHLFVLLLQQFAQVQAQAPALAPAATGAAQLMQQAQQSQPAVPTVTNDYREIGSLIDRYGLAAVFLLLVVLFITRWLWPLLVKIIETDREMWKAQLATAQERLEKQGAAFLAALDRRDDILKVEFSKLHERLDKDQDRAEAKERERERERERITERGERMRTSGGGSGGGGGGGGTGGSD